MKYLKFIICLLLLVPFSTARANGFGLSHQQSRNTAGSVYSAQKGTK